MSFVDNLALGFQVAVSIENLLACFVGCVLGTLIGVLPGLGPLAALALLLPFTFTMEPTGALIMLAGIYYGAQYGGSTTAILVNLPGEPSSAITVVDGYKMAKAGKGGIALSAAAIGSFFAGCMGTLFLAAFAVPISTLALKVGPADYFSLMLLGLVGSVALGSGSLLKAVGLTIVGILLGLVGSDVNSGVLRFGFNRLELADGLSFLCIATGLFGISEIVTNLERPEEDRKLISKAGRIWPDWSYLKRMVAPILRGTGTGLVLGPLPGIGSMVAAFAAYSVEKKFSRHAAELGTGAVEGVAAPEAANNAAAQANFIPLLSLGIPGGASTALLLGAMIVHDIQPGPLVITKHPDLFWGLIVSMWVGNAMLLILNLPLVGIWVSFLRLPYFAIFSAIVAFCCVGVYAVNFAPTDIIQMAGFGLLGYLLVKIDLPLVPLVMGFVLGPLVEENFRRALILSQGDLQVFLERPISLCALTLTLALLAGSSILRRRGKLRNLQPQE